MARLDVQGAWETSRVLTWLLTVWEGSVIYAAIMAILRYISRVAPHSVSGRIWLSDWPDGRDFAESVVGRLLIGFNRWLSRVLRPVGVFFSQTWDSSRLVRVGRAVVNGLAPALSTSWFFQSFLGYAGDTALAPLEVETRAVSPFLPALGAVLGFLALIPSPGPGQGGLNPTILMVLGIWGVAGLWLLQKVMAGDFTWRASSVFLGLAAFVAIAATAMLQSADRGASFESFLLWVTAILLFLLMVNLTRNTRDVAAFMGPVMAGAVLMAFWSLYQFKYPPVIEEHWVDPSEAGLVRTFAGMNNPNYLALFMELYIPLVVGLWVQQPKRRLELTGILGLMGIALLLTQSRGGWLGLAVAAAVFIVLRAGRWSFLMVLGAALVWAAAPQSIRDRVLTAFNPEHTSNLYRTNIRIGVLRTIKSSWFLGTGLGAKAFTDVYQRYMLSGAGAAHAHNVYLQMIGETGVFGFAAIAWALFATIRRTVVDGFDRLRSPVVASVAAAMVGVLVHGTAEHIWYNPKVLFSFWAVAGLGMGLALSSREGTKA
ncbi:MAG TPA: O-antigen ligase family protein [Symbiobacteriaceae bacterium]|nr:O-antigen ligase family protein [Symbiobacteriaceae bacterium]